MFMLRCDIPSGIPPQCYSTQIKKETYFYFKDPFFWVQFFFYVYENILYLLHYYD